jgi:putative oxidoreductase
LRRSLRSDSLPMRTSRVVVLALWVGRVALAVTLLSAVADRFGVWGPYGSPRASWGDWAHFVAYCGVLNSFAPRALVPALAWISTGLEIGFGVALLIGYKLEYVAYGSAGLFALFALAMTWSLGIKQPLNYSVFADAGGALLLGALASVVNSDGRSERGSYVVADAGARWAED